jgi:hypothetical protein
MNRKWVAPMAGRTTVRIPSGNHDMTFYVKWSGNTGNERVSILSKDMDISYNFTAGHRYALVTDPFITTLMYGVSGRGDINVNIVDITPSTTTNGSITITNASELNGKYVYFVAPASSDGLSSLVGYKSRDKKGVIGGKVENGIIELPLWYMHLGVGVDTFNFDWSVVVYKGREAALFIADTELFRGTRYLRGPQVTFAPLLFNNGKVEIDFSEGTKKNW